MPLLVNLTLRVEDARLQPIRLRPIQLWPAGRSRNWPKSKLAEVEIGRSRNWPKSNWPNSKKKLAEVEIGRSRPRPESLPGSVVDAEVKVEEEPLVAFQSTDEAIRAAFQNLDECNLVILFERRTHMMKSNSLFLQGRIQGSGPFGSGENRVRMGF